MIGIGVGIGIAPLRQGAAEPEGPPEYVVDGFPFVEGSWDNSEEAFEFTAGKAVARLFGGSMLQTAAIVPIVRTYHVVFVIDSISATADFLRVTIFGNGTTTGARTAAINTAGTHTVDLVVSTVANHLITISDGGTDAVISKLSIT